MFQGKLIIYYFLFILLITINQTLSTSISFSYRTCLPDIDLINIEFNHSSIRQYFHLSTKDFRLHILYKHNNQQHEYQYGHLNLLLPYSDSYDYPFQKAIEYYHEIDTWHYVNITFDDYLSKVFISFNSDETRLIPLIDYPIKNQTTRFNVNVLVDYEQTDVICLLPYSGFDTKYDSCSINIKTCG